MRDVGAVLGLVVVKVVLVCWDSYPMMIAMMVVDWDFSKDVQDECETCVRIVETKGMRV